MAGRCAGAYVARMAGLIVFALFDGLALLVISSEIEEIVINGSPASGAGTAGGDRFELIGDFAEQGEETSLRLNTITIIGSEGDDTVDISQLAGRRALQRAS